MPMLMVSRELTVRFLVLLLEGLPAAAAMINIQRLQNFQPRPAGRAGKPDFRMRRPQGMVSADQPRLDGMSATIAFAISCSPITTLVAPCFFKCSISASE
jgi:hypothetical protein